MYSNKSPIALLNRPSFLAMFSSSKSIFEASFSKMAVAF